MRSYSDDLPDDMKPILGAHTQLGDVSAIERIMLACDGTFTFQLEALIREQIKIELLDYSQVIAPPRIAALLEVEVGEGIRDRQVLLVGRETQTPYVYAHSQIFTSRLPDDMRKDLHHSPDGIGRLFVDYKLSVFRELVGYFFEENERHSQHFNMDGPIEFLARTYRVFYEGAPVMIITEKMPRFLFGDR